MPEYKNGCIILNSYESQNFFYQIYHPDRIACGLRDKFLKEFDDKYLVKQDDFGNVYIKERTVDKFNKT